MRPKSINLAEMFGWIATGLGALSVFVMLIQALSQRPGPGAGGILVTLFQLLLLGALGAATYFAGKRRHEAGRWGFIVVGALLALQMLLRLNGMAVAASGMAVLYILLDMIALAAILAGIVALLQPEASSWFAQGPIIPAPRPATPPYPGYGTPYQGQPGQPGYPPQDPAAQGYPPQQQPYPPNQGFPPQGQPPHSGLGPDGTPLPPTDLSKPL